MASNFEMDIMLKRAVRLLHSSNSNSAVELRQMLDEAIKQRYGAEKMLCKTLSKQQLEEEKNFPGRVLTPPPQLITHEDEVINLASPTKTDESPDTIMDSDEGANSNSARINNIVPPILTAADDVNLKEFGDLNCCVCGEMMFTATNRLIECSKCGALYHQECHKPPISDADASEDREQQWLCSSCDKPSVRKTSITKPIEIVVIPDDPVIPTVANLNKNKSTSSSSSNSSSPFYKNEQFTSKQKSHRDEQRSSSSKSNTSNSNNNVVTPSIKVISAPDRNSTHSKRTNSQSSSKSSRSRHSENSSGRKKTAK